MGAYPKKRKPSRYRYQPTDSDIRRAARMYPTTPKAARALRIDIDIFRRRCRALKIRLPEERQRMTRAPYIDNWSSFTQQHVE